MGRYTGKSCRFIVMMTLTTAFFFVELVTGYVTKSLALVSDSFHMMSDIIALFIGFLAMRYSKKTTPKNTYGWQRSEVLGALVNSVFLMALCFTIFVEAIQRFVVKETVERPILVLIVGVIGLVVNGIGLCLFSTHGMSHGHSHGGSSSHGHSHKDQTDQKAINAGSNVRLKESSSDDVEIGADKVDVEIRDADGSSPVENRSAQLNMRGVFLHVLGDALGSVVVIISALFIWLTDYEWRHYVDPAMSLIIVAIITVTTVPLFRQSSMILLQSIPADIDVEEIEKQLKENVEGIANIHELHVWQLSGNKYIATAHILFHSMEDYSVQAQKIKSYLHDQGIHSTTIQPEFIDEYPGNDVVDGKDVCKILCKPNSICDAQKCCGDIKSAKRKSVDHITVSSAPQDVVSDPAAAEQLNPDERTDTCDFSSNPMDQDV